MFESNADFEIDETLFQDVSISQLNDPQKSKISRGAFKRPKIPENAKNLLDKIDGVGKSANARKLQRKTPSFEKLVVQRKFPGPAGLLPDRRNLESFKTPNETEDKHEIEICSQDSSRGFDDEAWSTMRVDLRRLGESLRKYNVDWVKRKGRRRRLINQKAPFLAAAIKSVKCTNSKMPMFILGDETGDIPATIVYDLYEQYADRLTVGSVIVLRQFGVLTTNGGLKHHITITANNLVTIYSVDRTNNANNVTTVSVRDVATDDLLDDIVCNDEAKFSVRDRRDSSNDDGDFRLKFSRTTGIRDNVNNHSSNDGVTKTQTKQACLSKHTENVSIWGGNCEDVFDDLNFDDFSEEFCEVASKHDEVKCVENEVVGGVRETLDNLDGCERSGTNENRRCDSTVRFKFKKYDCHRTGVLDSIGLLNTSENHERNYNRQGCVSEFCDNVVAKSVDVPRGKNVDVGNASSESENQELPMSKRKKLACKDKLNAFKFRPKEVEAGDGIEKCARVCDLKLDTREERTRQMIDCSQISVISGNDDCDVLKDVFRDLDESVLFDDF